jgi:methionyl-tRNA formyltransferase
LIQGATRTGLTIFRPTDGLDEGPVILQKACDVGPDETLGEVYFNKLFPQGVAAMLEAADLVVSGRHTETVQDESQASYEGWCRSAEARIDWAKPVDQVYNLIRGCNPAPGAWTTLGGKKLYVFEARKIAFRRFADVAGKIGEVTGLGEKSFKVTAQGGHIEVLRARHEDGKKVDAAELARTAGLAAGTILGN